MVVSFMIAFLHLGAAPCGRPHPCYEHHHPDPTPPPDFFEEISGTPVVRDHDSFAATALRLLLVRTEGVAEGFRPAKGVLFFEDPAITSKILALERPAFAHPGDVLTVSELFRLRRDLVVCTPQGCW
ncbi:hypothetical protein [Microbispora sp. NPDC046933]|uniref:hypothetical protein n=1 Tax=Microbispora sp. NPDC046933 TaxID=3155618 RepID=UPI0033D05D8E